LPATVWILKEGTAFHLVVTATVVYVDMDRGVRRSTIKDQSDLKRYASGTNDPRGAGD
jgi:hypothetical protein